MSRCGVKWCADLFERFDAIKLRYLGWVSSALATIQSRLGEGEAEAEPEN